MTIRPCVIALSVLSLVGTFTSSCYAWNSTGHEVVAQIAYDQLSPQARAAVFAVLRNHPRLNEDLLSDSDRAQDTGLAMFLRAATWPDMVRFFTNPLMHTENHPKWHYMDFPFELDGVQGPMPDVHWNGHSDPANLPQAMDKMLAELKDPTTPKDRKAIDMCWVEHLVGDIHQPLHATSLFSKEFPRGDQGGNQVFVKNAKNVSMPLHTYWDDVVGMALDYNSIRKIADRIEAEHPAAQLKDQVSDPSLIDWAKESFETAKSVVYMNGTLPHVTKTEAISDPNSVPVLSAEYQEQSIATADMRIALAGGRLAALLEQVAKGL
jgi:S1/P1 Nuclease